MDQLMVDAGDRPVEVGDEVVLLGRQGDEEITATEWAERLGTSRTRSSAGIGPRVPRRYVVSVVRSGRGRGGRRGRGGGGRRRARSTAPSAPSSAACASGPTPTPGRSARSCSTRPAASRATTSAASSPSARGEGPTVLLSHGVTLTSRVWVKQFAALPERGVRVVAFDHRGHGESLVGDSGHSDLEPRLGRPHRGRGSRPARRRPRRSLDGRDRGAGVRDRAPRGRRASACAGIVLLSTLARTHAAAARAACVRAAEHVVGGFDLAAFMERPELGTALARYRIRAGSAGEPRRADPRRCSRAARPRRPGWRRWRCSAST